MECSKCTMWEPRSIENRSEEFGACHYYPAHGQLGGLDSPDTYCRWHFPLTLGDDWCSSYTEKETGDAKD